MNYIKLTLNDKVKIFFSGKKSVFGLISLAVAIIMMSTFSHFVDFNSLLFMIVDSIEAEGKIAKVESTNITFNEKKVFYAHFEYDVNGKRYFGKTSFYSAQFKKGDLVVVEYLPNFWMASKLKTSDLSAQNLIGIITIIVAPFFGIGMLMGDIKRLIKTTKVLTDFELAKGRLVNKTKTGTEINDQPMFELTYQYFFTGKTYSSLFKSFDPDKFDTEELLIIGARVPTNAILLKRLPINVSKAVISKYAN